jgi:lysophospholipase L1-like esterase
LHPTTAGYQIWAESMQPLLDEMMKGYATAKPAGN